MPANNKQASAQLGTYVTMIVGLLFLFLVVSQAGKYAKDGILTGAIARAEQMPARDKDLLQSRERTMLKIGAVPVEPVQQLSGMPGRPATPQNTAQRPLTPPQAPAQPTRQVTGRGAQDDLTAMQRSLQDALRNADHHRSQTTQTPPTQPTVPAPQVVQTVQTPEVAQPAPGATKRQYTVRANETLYSIALKIYGNGNRWNDILKANPDMNPHKITPGIKLNIPEPEQPSAAYRRWAANNEG